ncbi:MAG: hypothetical protein OHK93_003566 [Ramalina farinacea]|uniref:CCD97-like C-terminal domain-containing protein n=1 Tax=Ramalina farinacea TaxID=258253 RepID=A0AA43QU83_9LECA|nr:hypothetical protein [Ramalina farinacea]
MNRPRLHSPDSLTRLQIKNRRKRYLELHPDYFDNPSLELADPLAYDRLIRRFQTANEREVKGKRKGYSGVLEADLWRAEAKVEAVRSNKEKEEAKKAGGEGDIKTSEGEREGEEADKAIRAANKKIEDAAVESLSKVEGQEIWRRQMELLFVNGEDGEFDYEGMVDGNEELDDRETAERERQDEWFDDEDASWIEENATDNNDGCGEVAVRGQTGVQDY